MSGPYADEYGTGGPDDDGVAMGVWQAFQGLDAAREAFVEAARAARTSPVVEALLAPLGVPADSR